MSGNFSTPVRSEPKLCQTKKMFFSPSLSPTVYCIRCYMMGTKVHVDLERYPGISNRVW